MHCAVVVYFRFKKLKEAQARLTELPKQTPIKNEMKALMNFIYEKAAT